MFLRTSRQAVLLASASFFGLLASGQGILANPEGGTVEVGSATIGQADSKTVLVDQQSQRAIINWDSFSVRQGETTRFALPNAQSVTLNRDRGGSLSEIQGNIESNGRFFLVNPNGILFGPGSRVDVAGLVATTHDIRSQDFMAGNYEFGIPGQPDASVITQGQISIRDLGFGAFVAPHVRNEGAVVARMGRVELASASGFTLDMHGDRLISFLVENPNEHQIFDANGEPVSALVENSGELIADGGVVVMSASAARGVVDSVINTDGIVQANTVEKRGGRIILGGGSTGVVRTAGRVQARGADSGETGGTVEVTGEMVVADAGTDIDASGMDGGGTILFGGDYLGGNTTNAEIFHLGIQLEDKEVPTARRTLVSEGATLSADAIKSGDGGKLIVWSDETTFSFGNLTARGGPEGGDGGFIETSGEKLAVDGTVDASSPAGRAGTWLLDPLDIAIDDLTNGLVDINFGVDIPSFVGGSLNATTFSPTGSPSVVGASMLEASLNTGTNTVVTTFNTTGPGSGNISLRTDINKTAGGDAVLGLYAVGDILIASGANVTSSSGGLSFDLFGRGIEAGNMGRLRLNGGSLFLLPSFGATLSTSSPMPNYVGVTNRNGAIGNGQGRVNLRFGQNRANYNYTANSVEYRTGAVDLRDGRSSGRLEMYFDQPVDTTYHNYAVRHDANHGFRISNLRSQGAARADALDGIPEIVSTDGLRTDFLAEGPSRQVPVIEVSLTFSERVGDYRVTAPSGQAILDAHLASLRPRAPIERVVQEVGDPPIYLGPKVPTLEERYDARFSLAEQVRIRNRFQRDFLPSSGANLIILADSIFRSSNQVEQLSALDEFLQKLSSSIGLSMNNLGLFSDGRNSNQDLEVQYSEILNESGWSLSPQGVTLFHSIGLDSNLVEKWTNTDGREYVFIRDGEERTIVDDSTNRGTFNYGPSPDSPEHLYLDVFPWVKWGTGPDDMSSAVDRMRLLLSSPYRSILASASSLSP